MKLCALTLLFTSELSEADFFLCWKNMFSECVAEVLCINVLVQWWSASISLVTLKHTEVVVWQLG